MTRDEAWALLTKYNQDAFHLQHAETVEGVMRYFARELGYGDEAKMLAGIATMVGHALPVFYGFHGGKGVLSAAAIALSLNWWSALICLAIFFVILETTKYMSLASMSAVTLWCAANIVLFWGKWFVVVCLALIAVLVIVLHRGNISRLIHGNERKTYLHKPKED